MNHLIHLLGDYDHLGRCLQLATDLPTVRFTLECNLRVVGTQTEAANICRAIAVIRQIQISDGPESLQEALETAKGIRSSIEPFWGLVGASFREKKSELLALQQKQQQQGVTTQA